MTATDFDAAAHDLGAIMLRYERPLLQFACRLIGDWDRARDVVQETFVKFSRNGVSRVDPATWLFTVCRNAALNVCRKERRMQFLTDVEIESSRSGGEMPYDRVEEAEARSFLMRIVATLPPRQQEVLQLKFQGGLSYQQIAQVTNTTANSVGVLIHKALKTLRERHSRAAVAFTNFAPNQR